MDADNPTAKWPIRECEDLKLSIVLLEIDDCTPAEVLTHVRIALKRAATEIATQYPAN